MSTTLSAGTPPATAAATSSTGVPWHVAAVLFASTSVLVGVLWDISWHQSIGRDTLFSPPHLAIYLGGVVAGIACGWVVLRTTFAGTPEQRAASITFWKYFRGPLGAWICIWGAIEMLTSAPFDDWWHNAYGLDVKILSPPHAVLAAGIGAINIGALLMVLPLQNRAATDDDRRRLARLFGLASGLVLLMAATMVSEYHYRVFMRGSEFYIVAAIAFPVFLAATARAGLVRWPATMAALVYSAVTLALMWILPLFPAEPKLAPVYIHVTRMVPPSFPLLLVVPALCIDLLVRRFRGDTANTGDTSGPFLARQRNEALLALAISAAFVTTFLAVQWPFAGFLMSDWAQNPVFAGNNFPYQLPTETFYYRRQFLPFEGAASFARGIAVAVVAGALSARVGLAWGGWMRRVAR
jgi:hypothetical protein